MIWCPFPNKESARTIAAALLEERLVACANLVGGVESMFLWQGKVDTAEECGVLFKTDGRLLDQACERIAAHHPYDTPAVMGWRCASAAATADWLSEALGEEG